MQLKASGVVPGVPDLILMWKGKAYGFEFKTITGTVSHAQMQVHEAWKEQGIEVKVIRSVEEFKHSIGGIITHTVQEK